MGCAASAHGATLQRDLTEAREKIDALEAELQAARASTRKQGAANSMASHSDALATSVIVPVAAAFEAARNAPDAVCISGVKKADGTPDFFVNGIFQKTGDMRNRRVVYAKIGTRSKVGLWCDEDGLWCVGSMADAGTSDCRASTSAGTQAPSPDRAAVPWNVTIKGKSRQQKAIKVEPVTEEDIVAETKRSETQDAADHAAAADFVRISGAVDADGNPLIAVNGDFAKTAEICMGRAVYEKLGSGHKTIFKKVQAIGLWCDVDGDWCVGEMEDVVRRSQKSAVKVSSRGRAAKMEPRL
jgi:hypothetical protein